MNRNKTIIQSGSTSTFIPGSNGKSGLRSNVTFFCCENSTRTGTYFTALLNNEEVNIYSQYQDVNVPIEDDYIIYSKDNITYSFRVTGEKSGSVYKTEMQTMWETQTQSEGSSTDISSIDLSISCETKESFTYRGFVQKMCNTQPSTILDSSIIYSKLDENYNNLSGYSYPCFKFKIDSLNNIPLGTYKIQIEFNTTLQSPGMDSRIANKFTNPESYEYPSDTRPQEINEKMSFRGYASNYSCKGYDSNNPSSASFNFDDEKLDNFIITIKDYNDGVGRYSYTSDEIFIPKEVLLNVKYTGHKYRCDMYIYINGINGSFDKVWMQDLTDYINDSLSSDDLEFKQTQ